MSVRCVDLFAGWGGFSEGARRAGHEVVWAANHWPMAVAAHAANHPQTHQECQDQRQANWSELPDFELLLASPCCQGHSQAAQPSRARDDRTRSHHDDLRQTAWAVVDCLESCRPRAAIIENVVDFRRWGPDSNGAMFRHWLGALALLGYHTQQHVLRASWYGAPQRRDRLFVVASLDEIELDLAKDVAEAAIGPCIEEDPEETRWFRVDDANANVRARIEKGRANWGPNFVSQHVTGHPGVPFDQPVRTITTKDQWKVVQGKWYRSFTLREYARAMGFGDDVVWPELGSVFPKAGTEPGTERVNRKAVIKGLGNAVCPSVAQRLITSISSHIAAADAAA
jgi:DNA (cytosine-5)-methyltransferase 1